MTTEPRKDRCGRCYQRAYHGRDRAAACACCDNPDPRVLVRKTLADGMVTLCGNCATTAGRRRLTLEELRAEVRPAGDRRGGDRRRGDRRGPERRVHVAFEDLDERRSSDRRAVA